MSDQSREQGKEITTDSASNTSFEVGSNDKVIESKDADVTLKFMEVHGPEVPEATPEEEKKLAKKVTWIILPLTMLNDFVLYMDKIVLSYAVILGLFEDTNMTQNQYNNSNTLFYVGFMIGQVNMLLVQKLPIGRFLTFITLLWSIVIFLHCTATNHQGIYALRFFLGFIESVVVPILNLTMTQFLTQDEKAATSPIFYSSCMGVTIPVGFIAYGVLHANISLALWKLFVIIIGSLTVIMVVINFFIYPNNPTDAKFLSTKEKVWVIRRVQKSTRASLEQKVFKKHQAVETVKDPVSWLFGLFFLLQQLANNLTYQQNLLYEGIGNLSNLDTTLVSVAGGGFSVICCIIATFTLYRKKNITAFSVVFWTLPCLAGSIAVVSMPFDRKIALLGMLCMVSSLFGIPWILMFSWNLTSCSGYTKRVIRSAIVMVCYCVANLISPQLWQEKDGPRYDPAWIVQIVLSFTCAPLVALIIWWVLRKRNVERKQLQVSSGFVDEDGVKVKVDKATLDLTDLENKEFIYPL